MYKTKHIINSDATLEHVELASTNRDAVAKIFLNLGGSLQTLQLNDKVVINDLLAVNYSKTYASSVLFPFTNRLEGGVYTFEDKAYAIDLKMQNEKNPIHGLVYNKQFEIISLESSNDSASLTIRYNETKKTEGFPFKYSIELTYILTKNTLQLEVEIKNNDDNSFPFNVGWHPYFYSNDLYNSALLLNSDKKLELNADLIPVSVKAVFNQEKIQIKDQHFDDCYIINGKSVGFKTPNYHITLSTSSKDLFLQVYTPENANAIAIEPKTGPANSFNNKLGLSILKPKESYNVSWTITLNDNEKN